jgi:glycolate oxidase
MEYNKLSNEIIAKLQALVGVQNVVTDAGQMEIYAHDEVTDPAYHHMPEAVVFAENTQQVAAVVKLANEYHFPVCAPRRRYRSCLRCSADLRRCSAFAGKDE